MKINGNEVGRVEYNDWFGTYTFWDKFGRVINMVKWIGDEISDDELELVFGDK
jgi:hypothetical protein